MSRSWYRSLRPSELLWIAPFVCIVFVGLGLFRPMPHIPAPAHYRTLLDAEGTPVKIAEPFRGVALSGGYLIPWYLENTHTPEQLVLAGRPGDRKGFPNSMMGWVYPEVTNKDSLWGTISGNDHGFVEIEGMLAGDPGVYLGGPVPLLRSVGLSTVVYWPSNRSWREVCITVARVESNLVGHPERGEAYIARYLKTEARLKRQFYEELQPSSLTSHPKALTSGMSPYTCAHDLLGFPKDALADATQGWHGAGDDAEAILAMNPDIFFLQGQARPEEMMKDPRWQGLKAVKDRRVYLGPGKGFSALLFTPIAIRWMDEISQPERMHPIVRQLLRERFMEEFDYRLSDDQIDELLKVNENRNSAGYGRFMRNYPRQQGFTK